MYCANDLGTAESRVLVTAYIHICNTFGGRSWTRTNEAIWHRIYSPGLLPLSDAPIYVFKKNPR